MSLNFFLPTPQALQEKRKVCWYPILSAKAAGKWQCVSRQRRCSRAIDMKSICSEVIVKPFRHAVALFSFGLCALTTISRISNYAWFVISPLPCDSCYLHVCVSMFHFFGNRLECEILAAAAHEYSYADTHTYRNYRLGRKCYLLVSPFHMNYRLLLPFASQRNYNIPKNCSTKIALHAIHKKWCSVMMSAISMMYRVPWIKHGIWRSRRWSERHTQSHCSRRLCNC